MSIWIIRKTWENNRSGEIGLIIPTSRLFPLGNSATARKSNVGFKFINKMIKFIGLDKHEEYMKYANDKNYVL